MRNRKRMNIILIVFIIISLFSFASCTTTSGFVSSEYTKKERVEELVKRVVVAPDKKIKDIIDSELISSDFEKYNADMDNAMYILLGDIVANSIKKDSGSKSYQSILVWHSQAVISESEYSIHEIEIEEVDELHYFYKVEIKTNNNGDDLILVSGNVQFNDENLIDYITLEPQMK